MNSSSLTSPSQHLLSSVSVRRAEKRHSSTEVPEMVKRVRLQDPPRKVLFPVQVEPSVQKSPEVTVSVTVKLTVRIV